MQIFKYDVYNYDISADFCNWHELSLWHANILLKWIFLVIGMCDIGVLLTYFLLLVSQGKGLEEIW